MKNIFFREDGEFYINENKIHLADNDNNDEAIKNLILHRLQNDQNDWSFENYDLAQIISSDISSFIGEKVSKDLISALKYSITNCLILDNLFLKEEIIVNAVPINKSIVIMQLAIISDKLKTKELRISLIYDLRNNRMIPRIIENVENYYKGF